MAGIAAGVHVTAWAKKWHGVPIWGWAVGGGAVVGVTWIMWRRHVALVAAASQSSDSAAGADQQGAFSPYANPETLVPVNQGLSQTQYQGIIDSIGKINGPPSTQPPSQPGTPKPKFTLHYIGKLHGKPQNIRAVAKRFAPHPDNADNVEIELRRIIALNPQLRGKSTVPGGFPLKVPVW